MTQKGYQIGIQINPLIWLRLYLYYTHALDIYAQGALSQMFLCTPLPYLGVILGERKQQKKTIYYNPSTQPL